MQDQTTSPLSQVLPVMAQTQQQGQNGPVANPWVQKAQDANAVLPVNMGGQNIPVNQQARNAQDAAIQDPFGGSDLSDVGSSLDGSCWNGLCESYAEDTTLGHTGVYPTAIAAYNANAAQGNINTGSTNIPKGAQLYFAADSSNGGDGHTGVSNGDGTFTAATYNGIKTYTLNQWLANSGQQYLGYSVPGKSTQPAKK